MGWDAEELANGIIEGDEAVCQAHAHGQRGEGLGDGVSGVVVVLSPWLGVHLCNYLAMSHDDARMHLGASVQHQGVHELLYVGR
jgi:hypothetical protein